LRHDLHPAVLHVPRPPGQAELQRPGPGPPAEPDPLHPPAHPRRQPHIAHSSDSSHNPPTAPRRLARLEVGGSDSHHAAIALAPRACPAAASRNALIAAVSVSLTQASPRIDGGSPVTGTKPTSARR